jgi:hypothetical protein
LVLRALVPLELGEQEVEDDNNLWVEVEVQEGGGHTWEVSEQAWAGGKAASARGNDVGVAVVHEVLLEQEQVEPRSGPAMKLACVLG